MACRWPGIHRTTTLGLVVTAAACLQPRISEPLFIAATISRTGLRSTSATEMENGYRLAVELVNAFGGIPLVAPLAGTPTLWAGKQRQWSVQMLPAAPAYLQGSVEIAARNGARTVALVYEDTEFPESLASGVREAAGTHGLEIVLDQSYPAGEADYTALASAARDAGGDLFIGGGYYEDAIGLTKAAAEVDYAPLLISLSPGPGDPRFATEVGDLARCVAGNAPWIHTISTSGYIADSEFFAREYENLHGRPRRGRLRGG